MAQLVGDRHYDGRADLLNGHAHAPQQPQQEWCSLRQCPRCWGRMTGPLAGWMAHGPMPGYDIQNVCAACLDTLALEPPDSPELVTWAEYLARQPLARRARRRQRAARM